MEEQLEIIVTGASGRMGGLIAKLVQEDPRLQLVGATETLQKLSRIENLPCAVSTSLNDVLVAFPQAVVVDFTGAEASLDNSGIVAKKKGAIVIGSTGFSQKQKTELKEFAKSCRLFWSANMSVGINALLNVLPILAKYLGANYDMEIMEIHHKRKKDAPSGTAIMLAETLAGSRDWNLDDVRNSAREGLTGERPEKEIGIQALRGGDVVGIHSTWFLGPGETIQVTHQAESRENFANGALRAARWLAHQKPGPVYSMQDVLKK